MKINSNKKLTATNFNTDWYEPFLATTSQNSITSKI